MQSFANRDDKSNIYYENHAGYLEKHGKQLEDAIEILKARKKVPKWCCFSASQRKTDTHFKEEDEVNKEKEHYKAICRYPQVGSTNLFGSDITPHFHFQVTNFLLFNN